MTRAPAVTRARPVALGRLAVSGLLALVACGDPPPADPPVVPDSDAPVDSAPVDTAPCDGAFAGADAGDEPVWYLDGDGDGYGAGLPYLGCPPETGWSLVHGDCDDADPDLHVDPTLPVRFVDVTAAAGLELPQWDPETDLALCVHEPMAGGAAVGDVDGDGLPDLFLPRLYAPDLLYRNLGDGTFAEEAVARGIDHAGTSNGAVFFDLDGDADLDLFVTSVGQEGSRLYVNDGAGVFTEEGAARGVDMALGHPLACSLAFSASAADVDGDGDLDLHVSAWEAENSSGTDRARLYLNDGAGHFVDGTAASGVDLSRRASFTSGFADVDGDGVLDLLVAGDWGNSGIWRGHGDGTFTEITAAAGVGTDENGMGSALGDLDGDGDLDWFVSAVSDPTDPCPEKWGCSGNRLYRNDGGAFTDITDAAGVRDGGWGWGAVFVDWDHDGALDLVQATGFPIQPFDDDRIRAWHGDGTGAFTELACAAGLDVVGQGRAVVPFDLDGDGDRDLLVTRNGDTPVILRNDGGDALPWLVVRLADDGPNRHGIGAVVRVEADRVHRGDVHLNSTFVGVGPAEAHFGLGTHEGPVAVEVTWPDGLVQRVEDVDVRQVLTVTRAE